jgi:hypothetical protein
VTDDLVKRLRVLSGMMAMGEPIKFGSDSFAMDEAADRIEQLEVALRAKDNIAYIIDGHGMTHECFTIVYKEKSDD